MTKETQAEKPASTNPSPYSDANRDGKVDSLADAKASAAKAEDGTADKKSDAPTEAQKKAAKPGEVYDPVKKVYVTPERAFEDAKANLAVAKETFRKAQDTFDAAQAAFTKAQAAAPTPATPLTEADPFDSAHRAVADAKNARNHEREVEDLKPFIPAESHSEIR